MDHVRAQALADPGDVAAMRRVGIVQVHGGAGRVRARRGKRRRRGQLLGELLPEGGRHVLAAIVRLLGRAPGLDRPIDPVEQLGQSQVRGPVRGVHLDGLLERGDRLARPVALRQDHADPDVGAGGAAVDPQDVAQLDERFVLPPEPEQHEPRARSAPRSPGN
jgi:hypothetical protein